MELFRNSGTPVFFFNNSDIFYCEKNNVSQVHTYIPKIQKKKVKKRY
jgi:hypothetical protein